MSRTSGASSSTANKVGTGSLTSAVSSLVRAQYGLSRNQSTPSSSSATTAGETTTTTTDLDKHVAELLLLEAKEKEERAKKSNSQWYFSDDEDSNDGNRMKPKTNKRFLKNMLKGVEEHNAPLRRKESETTSTSIEEIRAKERRAREIRLGLKDSERLNKSSNSNKAGPSTARTDDTSGRNGSGRGPGFAARMLANGLSGAISSREAKTREDKQIKNAIEDARRRADSDRRDASDSADDSSGRRDAAYHRTRDVKGKGRELEDQKRYEGHDNNRDYRHRHRSSRSRAEEDSSHRSSRHRHIREDSRDRDYSDSEDRERSRRRRSRSRSHSPRDTGRRADDWESTRRRPRAEASSRHSSQRGYQDRIKGQSRSPDRKEPERSRRHRRRSMSTDSMSSLSEHASEASSDTFIDYTGAGNTVGPSNGGGGGGGSKMDKYFSSNYNPALDIRVEDLEDPKTGLIGEGNFSEWDKMLQTLKQRKEDKIYGVTKAREEERERQLRKLERKRKREERELRHALKYKEKKRKKKKRRYSSDDDESTSRSEDSIGPKEDSKSKKKRKSEDPGTVVIDGFEYGKRGSTRAWDLGKQ